MMGVPADEYDDEYDDGYDRFGSDDDDDEAEDRPSERWSEPASAPAPAPAPAAAEFSSFSLPDLSGAGMDQHQMVVAKPERFEDASGIADHIIDKRTVLLNLETLPMGLKRRLVDFLSGVAYSNRARIEPVANSTYLIVPHNVNLMEGTMPQDSFPQQLEGEVFKWAL